MVQWRADRTAGDETTEEVLTQMIGAYHTARRGFVDRAPARVGS